MINIKLEFSLNKGYCPFLRIIIKIVKLLIERRYNIDP